MNKEIIIPTSLAKARESPNLSCKYVCIILCQVFAIWIMFSVCFISITQPSVPLCFSSEIWVAMLDVVQLHISKHCADVLKTSSILQIFTPH